ncbi:MAG: type III secretion system export apparatus subunit SctU [Paracoccaceae bacterium]
MAEGGEKTEQPTPKRLRDAREKGQVARSQEVVTTISLFGVLIVIYALGGAIWYRLVGLMDTVARLAAEGGIPALREGIAVAWVESVLLMMPILAVTIALAIAANWMQVGTLFSLKAVAPSLEKISIPKGFKRIFSMKQVVELLKSIFKIVFLSALLFIVLRDAIGPYVMSVDCGLTCLQSVTMAVMIRIIVFSALAFVIVALFDFVYQRHSHTKQLMMSKEEVKREYKEAEGDPMVKGQRKQVAQELAMGDAPKQVKNATAVVMNPTHIAVAIRYTEGQTPLPIVVAKGRGTQAQHIRVLAEEAGVPVFRSVPTARLLFAETALGDFVPDEAFEVVAEILSWVARHEDELYDGPATRGALDMARGDHKAA